MKPFIILPIALAFLTLFTVCKKSSPTGPTPPEDANYKYFYAGNQNDVITAATPGYVLMGGGSDVDEAFRWMIQKSGGGDFVILRCSGTDAYNSYILGLGTVDSVETLVVHSRAGAANQFVTDKIRNAEAIFIAGGDQADYLRLWKGTPLHDALNYALSRGAVVGGTSAGLAVLGQFIFAAYIGTVYSPEALANPYNSYITLERNFLLIPLLQNVITDSHFVTRNRMGRLIVFMGRIIKDGWSSLVRGIGVDEATALLVESNGSALAVGGGAVYFLLADQQPEICVPSVPLTFRYIPVYRIHSGGQFNVLTWQGSGGTSYFVSVLNGILSSSTGSIY